MPAIDVAEALLLSNEFGACTAFPTPIQFPQIGGPPEGPNMVFLAKLKKTTTAMPRLGDRLMPVPAPSTLHYEH